MRTTLAAFAAAYLCATPLAWAGYTQGVDEGTGISKNGIVPVPGEGVAPFWGGNSRNVDGPIATVYDVNGRTQPYYNGVELTMSNYEFGGALNIAQDSATPGFGDVVGYVGGVCVENNCTSTPPQAAVWSSNLGFINLQPAGYVASMAQGLDSNGDYVGWAQDSAGLLHPMIWYENVDVIEMAKPAGFTQAVATGVSNPASNFGGYGVAANGATHPIAWSDGPNGDTPNDVLPAKATSGVIVATDPNIFGGWGGSYAAKKTKGQYHAMWWSWFNQYNPIKEVDLNPKSGFTASSVYAMRTVGKAKKPTEVGLGVSASDGTWHALVWQSTAKSAIDLGTYLPPGFTQSVATGVDENGNVQGAALDTSGVWHQMAWWKQ